MIITPDSYIGARSIIVIDSITNIPIGNVHHLTPIKETGCFTATLIDEDFNVTEYKNPVIATIDSRRLILLEHDDDRN